MKTISLSLTAILCLFSSLAADDRLMIGDICRLKGQEENTIQGVGIVVGLRGTGDSDVAPTLRALARMIQLMGGNLATDAQGFPQISELESSGNVALVTVTAKIPPAGAQQGDQLNCTVSAISAKSLQGGNLMLAYMLGPRADVDQIYALAQGPIDTPDLAVPTTGVIYGGCKMEATVQNQFTFEDKITLIIDKDLASFSTAVDIADGINVWMKGTGLGSSASADAATAIDQLHVEVQIPSGWRARPVMFVSEIEQLELRNLRRPKRVVLNETDGVIIIGEDVLINPVVIAHKNLSIEARPGQGGFIGLDTATPGDLRPKLKNLVDALNAIKVPTADVIAIIRNLDRNGDLYGEVIIN